MTTYLLEAAIVFVPAAFGSLFLAWLIVETYWRLKYE